MMVYLLDFQLVDMMVVLKVVLKAEKMVVLKAEKMVEEILDLK
jgi:hypothetical protein